MTLGKRVKETIDYYSRHNFMLYRHISTIKQAEQLDPEELEIQKRKKFIEVVKYAKSNSPFYKDFYKHINVRAPFDELYASIPELDKPTLRENGDRIATMSQRMMKEAHTSGTSGTPVKFLRPPSQILKENAYVWNFRMGHGVEPGTPALVVRGSIMGDTLYQINKTENHLYISSYALSKKNIQLFGDLIQEFQPQAIYAYPHALHTLVLLAEEAGIPLEAPAAFTSSESLFPFQRSKIEPYINGKIFDWYGNGERTVALGQCSEGNYHEPPFYGYTEYRKDTLVTTSLFNKGYPIIKYVVDDVLEPMTQPCACGRGVGIKTIVGRTGDLLKLPDGTKVGGSALAWAFRGVNYLQYSQLVQTELSTVDVNIVTAPDFSSADLENLRGRLRKCVNESIDIRFKKVEEKDIIKTKAGKFQLIISRI